jgi:glycosyltransferase involved in cell wall biosynthesis
LPKYSVVIPCYCSAQTIEKVVQLTVDEFCALKIEDFEFILVNDCSPDNGATLTALRSLAQKLPYVKVVDLGKNAGQHNAVMAALHYAEGDFIIAMDDDMQTHPSQIAVLRSKIEEGYDIVYGYYPQKKESLFRRAGSALNYFTVRALIHKPKWLKTSSFWIIRKYVRDYVIQYSYPTVHLQGVFLRTTSNIACVPIEHFERAVGTSGYTLKKLFHLYSNILSYSIVPIQLVPAAGGVLFIVGVLIETITAICKSNNPALKVDIPILVGVMCLFTSLILTALGIIGNYIGRMFMGQNRTPQFVVRDLINITEKKEEKK